MAALDDEDDGFVCANCQRGRCSRCNDSRCSCCYGGDPDPWPPLFEWVRRLLPGLASAASAAARRLAWTR